MEDYIDKQLDNLEKYGAGKTGDDSASNRPRFLPSA